MNHEADFEKLKIEIKNYLEKEDGTEIYDGFEDYEMIEGLYSLDKLISVLKRNFVVIHLEKD